MEGPEGKESSQFASKQGKAVHVTVYVATYVQSRLIFTTIRILQVTQNYL